MKVNRYLFAVTAVLALVTGGAAAQQQAHSKDFAKHQVEQQPAQQVPDLSQGPQDREEKRRLKLAREREGLRAAAELEGGGYVEEVEFDDELMAPDLRFLAGISDLVVRGMVKSNMSHLVRRQERGFREPIEIIETDYTIAVFDVYKGDPGLHSQDITVRIPGGRVEFEDGLWAEARLIGMAPPLDQEEFFLFLRADASEKNVYKVTFARQGLFQVSSDGRVIPAASSLSLISKYTKRDYGEFLEQLREAVAK